MRDYICSLITDQRADFISLILKAFLLFCSFIYGFIVKIISFGYIQGIFRRYRPNCKVISVGNITWGGTGKTPMVEMLADYLQGHDHKIVVLARGYKRKTKSLDNLGDESYLLTKKLLNTPILVGRNRIKNAKRAIREYNPDTIILDDGFQHWRMRRDLDIVMIDTKNAFGNGHLMPRGILRESISSLKRAQILVLTKSDLNPENLSYLRYKLSEVNPKALIIESIHKPKGLFDLADKELPLDNLENKNVCLLCSIADPNSFEETVVKLGAKVSIRFFFPDHHAYLDNDIKNIKTNLGRLNIDTIVTTEKDIVKLKTFADIKNILPGLIVLQIRLEIKQDSLFYDRLLSIYRG